MKTFSLFYLFFLLSISSVYSQENGYIFLSNGISEINNSGFLSNELSDSKNIELISLGDNEINLLQSLSHSCTDCKIRTVIGDKDVAHQLNPVIQSFKYKKKTICPDPIIREMDDNHVMIILNSNWFIDREYKFNAQNYDCNFFNEIHLLEELEDLLEEYKEWNKIIVTHHGTRSISEISGRGLWMKKFIPIYGQLYMSFRKNIGFNQDLTSQEYQKYISLLSKVTSKFDNLCILSGHDYLNHVINDDYITHINVNSSKKHFRYAKNEHTSFVSEEANYLSLRKKDNQWKFEFISKSGSTEISNVFKSKIAKVDSNRKNQESISTASSTVQASTKYDANGLTRLFMGDGYRSEWSEPVATSFLDISEYDGGLKPYAIGGGLQTMSIKFKSKNGKKYAFRVLDKKPEKSLSDIARESVYRVIVQELITTMHPYGPLVADKLLDATDIIHIKPELFILKPNPLLGDNYQQFVGKIGTLEEKPSGKKNGKEGFYGADKIVSSYDMFISLRKSHKHKLDPLAYAKARLMDMYLGDWDRHEDNWKWAMFREGKNKIYRPIPKDRDHVFSKWTGIIPTLADMAVSNAEDFGDEFGNLRNLNFKARFLDRELGGEINLDIWLEAAKYLQESLTDEVIEDAVSQMPPEVLLFHGEEIARKLKSRRADLPRAIKDYYKDLNVRVYITGTNKSDIFQINRLEDGLVQVIIYDKKKEGRKGDLFFSRTLDPAIVKEIYCFGLDGDDIFHVAGDVQHSIKVRIVGGSDQDNITDLSNVKGENRLTQVYDSSEEDIITSSLETVIKRPSRPAQYDPYAFDYNWLVPSIILRSSSGNGTGFGGGVTYMIRGFNKPDFAKKWTFGGVYYPDLKAHRIEGGYTFRHFIGLSDLQIKSRYSTLYDRYPFYYGIGNDTKVDKTRRRELNSIDYDFFDFEAGLTTTFAQKSTWSYGVVFENHDIENRGDHIAIDTATNGFGEASYVGLKTNLALDFSDNALYPENGSQFDLSLEGRTDFDGGLTGNINTRFSHFKTFDLGLKTTFIASLRYKQAIGTPAFYHLSRLGSQSQFRGYTRNRFIDKYALMYNSEVRILLGSIKTPLIRIIVGVFGFYDGGRVWNDSSEFYEGEWNNSYGGGIFFAPGSKEYSLSILVARPEDNFTYSKVQLGFDF
jgi:hypothetical protein